MISAGVLDGLKARVLLSLVLSINDELTRARALFEEVAASMSFHDGPSLV